MATWTSIFNMAVVPLGMRRVTSIDDGSASARACSAVYLDIADEVMSVHPWKVCRQRTTLAANSTAPAFGYANAFDLPSDPFCLRAWRVCDPDNAFNFFDDDSGRWEVEGRQILTDLGAPLKLIYLKRVTNPGLFAGLLATAIATRLRKEVAFTLTESQDKEDKALAEYERILVQARSLDSQQGTPEPAFDRSSILEARW